LKQLDAKEVNVQKKYFEKKLPEVDQKPKTTQNSDPQKKKSNPSVDVDADEDSILDLPTYTDISDYSNFYENDYDVVPSDD